jgi:phosphoglycolate phosphatase-like HAD superfamily hydrolase
VHAALAKAGATAPGAMMVGDSIWDIQSAARAGVPCLAVLAGGTGGRELRDAGAVAVYEDAGDLLRNLEASPLLAR